MFKHLGALAVLIAALPALAADKSSDKIRVILIDGQNNHNWRATTPLMKKELERCGRFTVDVASDLGAKDKGKSPTATVAFPPDLSKYDVLLSNFNGAPWPNDFQKDLEDRLRESKIGLVIVHA